jgi:ribosomal protein S18 acetylase RimI-like enzyme
MLQSSITAWLKKPASITKAEANVRGHDDASLEALPTPPPESPLIEAPPASTPPIAVPRPNSTGTSPGQPTTLAHAFDLKPLPTNVEFAPLSEDLMPSFKRLNSLLLPIPYPAAFYTETMTEPHHSVTLVALWHPTPLEGKSSSNIHANLPTNRNEKAHLVGAIRCRVLPSSNLYISTIGLLAPYRSHGIATHLLHRIVVKAAKEHGVRYVTAHVWEANEDGLEWYQKRGFEIIGREEGYYRKLKPGGAILVRRWIGIGDFLGDADAK